MSFPIALSGLNAASADLSVTAHNVSNAATLGFKEGRIEFAEVYQSGVRVADTRQQFTPGNIEFTGNDLDLAISGDGFFTVSDNGSLLYSRAGAFGVDRSGDGGVRACVATCRRGEAEGRSLGGALVPARVADRTDRASGVAEGPQAAGTAEPATGRAGGKAHHADPGSAADALIHGLVATRVPILLIRCSWLPSSSCQ